MTSLPLRLRPLARPLLAQRRSLSLSRDASRDAYDYPIDGRHVEPRERPEVELYNAYGPPPSDEEYQQQAVREPLPSHVRRWNHRLMDARTAAQIMHRLCVTPVEAYAEPMVWATLINVFKRHGTSDGVLWVLAEMRQRGVRLNAECLANLLSAWGHLGLPHLAREAWGDMKELQDATGIERARLLSITAVALARNRMACDEELVLAIQELEQHNPRPVAASFSWGRCVQACIMLEDTERARAVFTRYCAALAAVGAYPSTTIVNSMIRGFGDAGSVPDALEVFEFGRDLSVLDAHSEVDMARAYLQSGPQGYDEALAFLLRSGDPVGRQRPFVWLLARMLENERVAEAARIYHVLRGHEPSADQEQPTEAQMLREYPGTWETSLLLDSFFFSLLPGRAPRAISASALLARVATRPAPAVAARGGLQHGPLGRFGCCGTQRTGAGALPARASGALHTPGAAQAAAQVRECGQRQGRGFAAASPLESAVDRRHRHEGAASAARGGEAPPSHGRGGARVYAGARG